MSGLLFSTEFLFASVSLHRFPSPHVAEDRRIVARQRELLDHLTRHGCDTSSVEQTLNVFVRSLKIFGEHLQEIMFRAKRSSSTIRAERISKQ
jgi:hypothetical protein